MTLYQLARQIWMANPGLTFEEAHRRAEAKMVEKETREIKQVRVVRAEEVR
jgi:hypothetical protein